MVKKLWIAVGICALLSPLGILLPRLFGAGGAWGEWGIGELQEMTGSVPEGMKRLAHLWRSPLPDYTIPGQAEGLAGSSAGYVTTAVIGILITAGIGYLLAFLLARREKK